MGRSVNDLMVSSFGKPFSQAGRQSPLLIMLNFMSQNSKPTCQSLPLTAVCQRVSDQFYFTIDIKLKKKD